jgi:hypothetical protein
MAGGQWWVIGESVALETGTVDNYSVYGPHTRAEADAKVKAISATTQSPGNVSLTGPFATQAAAEQAVRTKKGVTPPSTGATLETGVPSGVPNPLSGLAAIAAALAKFAGYLGDISMWRSLGWLLLGAVMIILGILLWLKKENFLPSVVPVPV